MILLGAFGWAGDKGGLWILVPFAAVLTSLLTAWYIGRQWTLVFMGQFRTPAFEHIREASLMMKVPMIILGALTVFLWLSLNPLGISSISLVSSLLGGAAGVSDTTTVGDPA